MRHFAIAVTLLFLSSTIAHAEVINPGFETPFTTTGELPRSFGYWDADPATTVATGPSISPVEGGLMLQFLATSEVNLSLNASNVWQLVDMSPYSELVASGLAQAAVSAQFNRVPGGSETDTRFVVDVYAFAGDPTTFPTQFFGSTYLARVRGELFSDSDATTWELLTARLLLPTDTDFVAVHIAADENVVNNTTAPEFDGHFADAVAFDISLVPEPPCPLKTLLGPSPFGEIRFLQKLTRTSTLYRFRDEVLARTAKGNEYIALYYEHAREVAAMLLRDPDLALRSAGMLARLTPKIQAAVDGMPSSLKQEDNAAAEDLMDQIAGKASPKLQAVIERVRGDLRSGILNSMFAPRTYTVSVTTVGGG